MSVAQETSIASPSTSLVHADATLTQLLQAARPCYLSPYSFFVSWQGVMTLAFSGFPPALLSLKAQIDTFLPGLPRENSGSKWPKVTLGCLKEGRRLTPEQLQLLIQLCRGENPRLPDKILVDRAAITLYQNRCLEKLVSVQEAHFLGGSLDASTPEVEEKERVQGIVAEADDPSYWFKASQDGNRENHYRGDNLGATLMHKLLTGRAAPEDCAPDKYDLMVAINRFQALVDEHLPDMYTWFSNDSLHITFRALFG